MWWVWRDCRGRAEWRSRRSGVLRTHRASCASVLLGAVSCYLIVSGVRADIAASLHWVRLGLEQYSVRHNFGLPPAPASTVGQFPSRSTARQLRTGPEVCWVAGNLARSLGHSGGPGAGGARRVRVCGRGLLPALPPLYRSSEGATRQAADSKQYSARSTREGTQIKRHVCRVSDCYCSGKAQPAAPQTPWGVISTFRWLLVDRGGGERGSAWAGGGSACMAGSSAAAAAAEHAATTRVSCAAAAVAGRTHPTPCHLGTHTCRDNKVEGT